jgi:hypothetical protein
MHTRRKIYARNVVVILLAIILMNYSVPYNSTAEHLHSIHNNENRLYSNAGINEIESVFELVTEEWLDIEDYVPEPDTDDAQEDISKIKTLFSGCFTPDNNVAIVAYYILQHTIHNTNFPSSLPVNIPVPPPDVA